MSDDHGDRDLKGKVPQQKIGTVLRSFFDHAASHDEEGVHAALCLIANEAEPEDGDTTDSMHVCNLVAGDPKLLAQMTIRAIETMIKEVPGFEKEWIEALQVKRLSTMIEQVVGFVKHVKEQAEEDEGLKAAKPAADALLEKLKGNPGAVSGPDTKQ